MAPSLAMRRRPWERGIARLAARLIGRWLIAAVTAFWAFAIGCAFAAQCFPIAEGRRRVVPAAFQHGRARRRQRAPHLPRPLELPDRDAGRGARDHRLHRPARPPELPDLVTMNNAHSSHYTDFPDPEIAHVLRGWGADGGVALHDVTYRDLHVRNVPTNVREFGGARMNGNSIFVFEIADLCIAHLGHLHHVLTDVHLSELGQIDVLLMPVDGQLHHGAAADGRGDPADPAGRGHPDALLRFHHAQPVHQPDRRPL